MTGQKELGELPLGEEFEKGMEEMEKEIKREQMEIEREEEEEEEEEEQEEEEEIGTGIRSEQIEQIVALQDELKIPMKKILGWTDRKFAAQKLEELSQEQAEALISMLEAIKEKRKSEEGEEEKKVIGKEVLEPEVAGEKGEEKGEEKWDRTIKTNEGSFSFRMEEDILICRNNENGNIYELITKEPKCDCAGFLKQKERGELCKHLRAAKEAGYGVEELPYVPAEVERALMKNEKKTKRGKAKKEEETVAIEVLGERVELVVQTPQEIIQNEEMAAEMIKTILGPKPKREDVIEEYGNIQEIAADVIISMAQYSGIRFQPINKEIEVTKMNLGKIFKAIPMSADKKEQYEALADFMPDTDVTTRCKITSIAGWRDKKGDLHLGMGTKEEHLTPYRLKDLVTRGANFIETMCESKSAKKSILGCLPITHDGLLSKIRKIYNWE